VVDLLAVRLQAAVEPKGEVLVEDDLQDA
jgi:hypothetical protein